MRILFDQGTPAPLRRFLTSHHVETAFERGWSRLSNGELLRAAEEHGFELLVTTDQGLRAQQNLTRLRLAIVVLSTTNWPRIRPLTTKVLDTINGTLPGSFTFVEIP